METINPVIKVPRSIDFRLRFPTATLDLLNGGNFRCNFSAIPRRERLVRRDVVLLASNVGHHSVTQQGSAFEEDGDHAYRNASR
jgi:hypothetical protein